MTFNPKKTKEDLVDTHRICRAQLEGISASQLLTYGDLSQILQLSQVTLRRYVSQGRLPYIKIGSSVRFEPGSVIKYIKSHACGAT